MQLRGKHIFDYLGKSYFKMDKKGVECKLRIFSKNTVSINWSDIEGIEVKLFEARIKTHKGSTKINLEKLSDDNLKLVKEKLLEFKNHLAQKEPLLA
jgi:hypothetical protein